MSHFTSIKTQIKNRDALVTALSDIGFKNIELHETAQHLYGYQGDVRQYIGSSSNDIGFKQQTDGQYEAIISEYDRHRYNEQWMNKLMQRYGYHALKATAQEQGFTIEEDEVMQDGTVKVVVTRWA